MASLAQRLENAKAGIKNRDQAAVQRVNAASIQDRLNAAKADVPNKRAGQEKYGQQTSLPAAWQAYRRLSYSLPVEAQASVGREKSPMTGTELREAAANQEQIKKDLNTVDLYANRGRTGTERLENYTDMARAAQRAAAQEERRRTAGLTGTERLAPIREAEQQRKNLEAEKTDMYSNPGKYIRAEPLTGTERKEKGSDYTKRFDYGTELAKRGAEYDSQTENIDQKLAELSAINYLKLAYEPDFSKYVKIGAGMESELRDPPDAGTHFGNRDAELYEGSYSGFDLLTRDEQNIYNYLLGKYGRESAEQYYDSMRTAVNHRYGQKVARDIQNSEWKTGALIANSLGTGVTNWMLGALGAYGAVTGQELPENSLNYASQYIKEDLGKAGQIAYDLGVTVGNMLPSVLIGGVAGTTAMGVSAGGNAYQQGLREGMTEKQAWKYGVAVGASEACLQKAMGGISRLSGVTDDVIKAVSGVENGILRFIRKTAWSGAKEGAEEALQAVLEPIFKSIVTGDKLNIDWSEAAYNALLGMFLGGVYGDGVNPQTAAKVKISLESGGNPEYTDIGTETMSDDAEEIHLRGSGQRADGSHTGRQIHGMEESAGRDPGRETKGRSADRETAALTYGEEVSTASLGIDGGTDKANVRLVTGGDTPATWAAKQMAREHNLQLVLFAGDNLEIRQRNGNVVRARALIDGDRVYVRADHAEFTAVQLMRHEAGHDLIAKGKINPNNVRKRIKEAFGAEGAEIAAQMYIEAYAETGLSPDEVWEEVICDSLGDMNIFSGTEKEGVAAAVLSVTKMSSADARTASTRGPPADKYSREIDREFQINFSGNVYSNRNVKLSNSAKAAIRSAIKSGNAHMAEDGSNGEVSAMGKVYLFDSLDSGDAHVYKAMSAEQLNIHDRIYGGANNGKTGRKGNKGASLNNGQSRDRVSDGAADIAHSFSEYESNGKLAESEPDGQRSRNASEGESAGEKYVSEDTYSPDYAHWRNAVKDSEPEARYSRELDIQTTINQTKYSRDLGLRGEPKNMPRNSSEWHVFNRSFANKVTNIEPGEKRVIIINTGNHIYFATADGCTQGFAEKRLHVRYRNKIQELRRLYGSSNEMRKNPDALAESYWSERGQRGERDNVTGNSRTTGYAGEIPDSQQRSDGAGRLDGDTSYFESDEIIDYEPEPGTMVFDGKNGYIIEDDGTWAEIKYSRELPAKENGVTPAEISTDRMLYAGELLRREKSSGNIYAGALIEAEMGKFRKGSEHTGAKYSRETDERRRALRKGEMVNEFRDKVNWPAYYNKLKNAEFNSDNYDDGDRATMRLGVQLLILEMQRNGEFSVVGIQEVRYETDADNYERDAGVYAGKEMARERTGNDAGSN